MADHADDGDGDDVFVYMGGSVPQHLRDTITHVRVHKSVKIITRAAFQYCRNLVSIEMHDVVEIIEEEAFNCCRSLGRIKLAGVRFIGERAFSNCRALENVEFGDKLETIGGNAFNFCSALRTNIKLPKVRVIGDFAFYGCKNLTEVELSEDLETIGHWKVFGDCRRLRRIAMPLNHLVFYDQWHLVFYDCHALSTVDLVGGAHKTVSSLLLESWRDEMNDKIDSINRYLSNTRHYEKTVLIQQWMERVTQRINHYKSEQYALLKKSMTLLELALWKIELEKTVKDDDGAEGHSFDEKHPAKKAKICEHGDASSKASHAKDETDVDAARQKARVTCGANIVVPHVLSFLNDADVFLYSIKMHSKRFHNSEIGSKYSV